MALDTHYRDIRGFPPCFMYAVLGAGSASEHGKFPEPALTNMSVRTKMLARMDISPARESRVSPIDSPRECTMFFSRSLDMRARTAADAIL